MSHDLLYALGEADANMYLCSKDLRPSKNKISPFSCFLLSAQSIVDALSVIFYV